jgi:3-hydroxypropanoate dehydrogenase
MSANIIDQELQTAGDDALDLIFRKARTHSVWLPKEVPVDLLKRIYNDARFGPTSANTSPARFVFIISPEAKERLLPAMAPLNVEKTRSAPVTVLVTYDTEFYEQLPKLFPQTDARAWFANNPQFAADTAFRNSALQGAYFIVSARAHGLDCGPMSGFDPEKVNAEFFPDGKWKVNFILNLGYGDHEKLFPRNPRLDFEEATIVL